MFKQTHPNRLIASILFIINGIVAVFIHPLINPKESSARRIAVEVIIMLLMALTAFIIIKKYKWVRAFLLVVVILAIYQRLIALPFFIHAVSHKLQILIITQHLLQITAVVLLYLIPSTPKATEVPAIEGEEA